MTTKTITGTITGGYTLSPVYSALSVTGSGLIKGGVGDAVGVALPTGGELDNAGRIVGGAGAYTLRTPGGAGAEGVTLAAAGIVNNQGAVIGGLGGPSTYVLGGAGGAALALAGLAMVDNQGKITGGAGGRSFYGMGGAGGAAITLAGGGTVDNTGAITGGAGGLGSIYGGDGGVGVTLAAGGAIDNLGEINGGRGGRTLSGVKSSLRGAGAQLGAGGAVTNGSASVSTALIAGGVGFYAGPDGAATLTNYGTIEGASGVSVQFAASSDRLIVEAGSTWMGAVEGGGGILELATGAGTISSLGATGTINGAEAMTFSGFGEYDLDSGTRWTLTGADTVASGSSLTVDGDLTVTGKLVGHGSFGGSGRLAIATGATLQAESAAAATLTVTFGGDAATLAIKKPKIFGSTISGVAVTDTIDLQGLEATSAKVDAQDRLEIFEGSTRVARLQLSGKYENATFTVEADGHGGSDITLSSPAPPIATHALIAAMAGLGATGATTENTMARVDTVRPTLLGPRPDSA